MSFISPSAQRSSVNPRKPERSEGFVGFNTELGGVAQGRVALRSPTAKRVDLGKELLKKFASLWVSVHGLSS